MDVQNLVVFHLFIHGKWSITILMWARQNKKIVKTKPRYLIKLVAGTLWYFCDHVSGMRWRVGKFNIDIETAAGDCGQVSCEGSPPSPGYQWSGPASTCWAAPPDARAAGPGEPGQEREHYNDWEWVSRLRVPISEPVFWSGRRRREPVGVRVSSDGSSSSRVIAVAVVRHTLQARWGLGVLTAVTIISPPSAVLPVMEHLENCSEFEINLI